MLKEDAGRLIACCDNCPVKLDMGSVDAARARNRSPSAWVTIDGDFHYCPNCSSRVTLALLAKRAGAHRRDPLTSAAHTRAL